MSDSDAPRWDRRLPSRTPRPNAVRETLSRRQWVLLAIGLTGLVVGLVGVGAPGIFGGIELSAAILFIAALLALGQASRIGYRRLVRGERAAWLPPVESRSDVDRPGVSFDEDLAEATAAGTRSGATGGTRVSAGHFARNAVRRRLADAVTRVVTHREGVDAETAERAIETGAWTADAAAGDLLRAGEGEPAAAAQPPDEQDASSGPSEPQIAPFPAVDEQATGGLAERLSAVLGGGTDVGTGARRATASLAAGLGGVESGALRVGDPGVDLGRDRWEAGVWETDHWRGVGSLGLVTLAIAVFGESPTLALAGAVFVGYAGYAWLFDAPSVDLAVERSFTPAAPDPGDHVTVTVAIENVGSAMLADCRVIDRVPDRLSVVDGCARHATAIAPGTRITFSYDVLAVAGDHAFGELAVAARDPSGERERTVTVEGGEETLSCAPAAVQGSVPLHPQASGVVGRVLADVGGSGTTFRSVREYRRGDPRKRIDWNRKARTGELGTLEFDEEHAATVVVLVDVRPAAALAPAPDRLSAIDRGLGGASQLLDTLLGDGDRVGVATVGLDWEYIDPATGGPHRAAMQALLHREEASAAAASGYSFNPRHYRRQLARRLSGDTQIVLFSPLCDDVPVDLARWLHAHGHRVTVFSPDPTGTGTVGGALSRIDRALHASRLRSAGVRVVDWPAEESLDVAVDRAQARWAT